MKKLTIVLSLAVLAGVAAFVSAEDAKDTKDATDTKQTASEPTSKPANGAINQFCAVETKNKIDPERQDLHLQRQNHRLLLPGLH